MPSGTPASVLRRLLDVALIGMSLGAVVCAFHHEWTAPLSLAALCAAAVFLLVGETQALYGSWRLRRVDDELRAALVAWGVTCACLSTAAYLLGFAGEFARPAMLVWFAATPAPLVAARLAARVMLGWMRRRGANSRSVAVAGSCKLAQGIVQRLEGTAEYGLRVSIYDDRSPERMLADEADHGPLPRSGNLADMLEKARRGEIDYVFIALPLRAEARVTALVDKLADTTASVYVVPDFFVSDLMRARWSVVGGMAAVSVYESPFDGLNGWLKRLEDLVLGVLLLLCAGLPMLVIAAAIRATTRGPVLFRQRRYGLNGRLVEVLKFRTMTCADDGAAIAQASRADPRVTPLGRLLRASSMDELPQLFNVLGGSMSLVGPRPHAVAHNEAYRGVIHGYMLRHKVKPGITGWAQVNGWRGETETLDKMRRRIEHDLEYVRNWSLGLDLKILASTVAVVLSRRNAF